MNLMLKKEYIDWIFESEWIEERNPGEMGRRYLEETYRLKDGAPEEVKKKWEELCDDFRSFG